jgi:hypothetical protein
MYTDGWTAASADDRKGVIGALRHDGHNNDAWSSALIETHELSFDPDGRLLRVKKEGMAAHAEIYFLHDGEKLHGLNGSSAPIHEANEHRAPFLNDETVPDYLRFFSFFVHGDEGPFYIVEALDDARIPAKVREYLAQDTNRPATNVREAMAPAICAGFNADEGYFECAAIVMYGAAIFAAEFHVKPDGMIEMEDDQILACDLPGAICLEQDYTKLMEVAIFK